MGIVEVAREHSSKRVKVGGFALSGTATENGIKQNAQEDSELTILGLKTATFALVLLLGGLISIVFSALLSASLPSPHGEEGLPSPWQSLEIVSHILRDLGIAAFISGLLGVGYEYWLRRDFLKTSSSNQKRAFTEHSKELINQLEEVNLRSTKQAFQENDQELHQLRAAGLERIYGDLSLETLGPKFQALIQKAQSASPEDKKPRLRILQTWMAQGVSLRLEGIMKMVSDCARAGCKVDMLLLNPYSPQVEYRAKAVGNKIEVIRSYIRNDLEEALFLCSELKEDGYDIEIKAYDAAPVIHLYDFDGIRLIGLHWSKRASINGPQFELVGPPDGAERSDVIKRIDEHFEQLWTDKERTKPADEALNLPYTSLSTYSSKGDAYHDLSEQIQGLTVSRLDLLQFSGQTAVNLLDVVARHSRRVKVRMLLYHPDEAIQFDSDSENHHRDRILWTKNQVGVIEEDLKDEGFKVDIRYYRTPPSISAAILDNKIISVSWYRLYPDPNYHDVVRLRGHNSAAITGGSGEMAVPLLSFAQEQFDALWTEAEPA